MILSTLWLGAASNLIGTGVNAISTADQNKKNRRFAEQQTDKQWHRSMDLRKWDNEYNSPQSQMQRLRQAGINPLLPFLGKGNATGGTSAPAQTVPKAEYKGTAPNFQSIGRSIHDIYDLKLKKAGTDKIIEETEGLKTANERALITWLEDKQYITASQAAVAAQTIAEAGLKDIEHGRAKGSDKFRSTQAETEYGGASDSERAGFQDAHEKKQTWKKANALIDANTGNIHANNMARKALKEWLDNPKGGWEALKASLLIILGK